MSKKFLLSYYKTVLCKFFWTRSKNRVIENRVIENRVMENRVKRGITVVRWWDFGKIFFFNFWFKMFDDVMCDSARYWYGRQNLAFRHMSSKILF